MEKTSEFYSNKGGDKLIDNENYPEAITNYLKEERRLYFQHLTQGNYDTLIEIGCMSARHLDIAIELNLNYIGIDIVSKYIKLAQQQITDNNYQHKAKAFQLSLLDYEQETIQLPRTSKPLCIFPFNSFGNIINYTDAIKKTFEIGYDFFISTYNTTEEATNVRLEYYKNCHFNNLEATTNKEGVLFTSSEGLHSWAFHSNYLRALLDQEPWKIEIDNILSFGLYYYVSKTA